MVIQESLLFPYIEGASFMAARWQEAEGRPVPFGAALPQSTEQILNPGLAPTADEDPPTELDLTLGSDVEVAYLNTLGQMEVGILLEELLGEGNRELAQGWDGDRVALLEAAGGRDGLVWASIWDTQEQRNAFVGALQGALSQLPMPGTLEPAEFLGRPGALLRVGLGDGVPVQVSEGVER
jgi:hypothetical protein